MASGCDERNEGLISVSEQLQPLSSAIENALHGHRIEDVSDEESMEQQEDVPVVPFVGTTEELDGTDDSENLPENVAETAGVTPKKNEASQNPEDPLTPTANLKILLHAASPEIRNYERRKELFTHSVSSGSNDSETVVVDDQEQLLSIVENEFVSEIDGTEKENVVDPINKIDVCTKVQPRPFNRKEKSLGLLCHRFLRLYPEHPQENVSICLDDAANKLCVGRRRIYDIINVLEAIRVVTRLAKNNYIWRGRNGLTHTLCKIRRKAELNGDAQELRNNFNRLNDFKPPLQSKSPSSSAPSSPESAMAVKRRNKSLGKLSEKFITLFLVQPHQLVSLDMAARVLITNGNPADNKYKTKVRRLYDIANILTSLKLIKKVLCSRKKPAFRWIGPDIVYKRTPVKAGNAASPKILMKSPLTNLWSSPEFKMVLPVAKDGSLSSLCEVAEQERRDMCYETPIKRGKLSIATPLKSGGYMLVTPGKITPSGNLTVTVSETDKIEDSEKALRSEALDSSFNSDEVFRQELELLRQRFPSPMSRLLSACNVEQAFAQHNENKAKRLAASQELKQDVPQASETSSPAKLSLAYLKQQQQNISKAVGSVTSDTYSNTTQLNTEQTATMQLDQNQKLPRKMPISKQNPKTIVCSDGRVLVPVSSVHFLQGPNTVQPLFVSPSTAPLHSTTQQQCLSHTHSLPPTVRKVPLLQSAGAQKPLIKINLNNQTVQSCKASRPIKILINPSQTASAQQCFNTAARVAGSDAAGSPGAELSAGKCKKILPANNFVKIDMKKPAGVKLISPGNNTCRPVLTSLSSLNNCIVHKPDNKGVVGGSVVTNLVSRLEQHGYQTGPKQPLRPLKIFQGVADYSSAQKIKINELQSLQCPKSVVGASKAKKRKVSSRKLNMVDENDDPEILEIMLPNSPAPPLKPLPEKPAVGTKPQDSSCLRQESVLIEKLYKSWDRHNSAFDIAEQSNSTSTPAKDASETPQPAQENDSKFYPLSRDELVEGKGLVSPFWDYITPSLVNTPINLPTISRPTSSISSLGDLDHIFSNTASRTVSPAEFGCWMQPTAFNQDGIIFPIPSYQPYCMKDISEQAAFTEFVPYPRFQYLNGPVGEVMQLMNNSTPRQDWNK